MKPNRITVPIPSMERQALREAAIIKSSVYTNPLSPKPLPEQMKFEIKNQSFVEVKGKWKQTVNYSPNVVGGGHTRKDSRLMNDETLSQEVIFNPIPTTMIKKKKKDFEVPSKEIEAKLNNMDIEGVVMLKPRKNGRNSSLHSSLGIKKANIDTVCATPADITGN